MRSIELLVRTYPEKTGSEIMQIVEQEKQEQEKIFKKANKHKLNFIEDINNIGGYYKGTFGLDQYFVYNFYDLKLIDGKIIGSVNKIFGFRNGIGNKGEFSFKREIRTYEDIENYGLSIYERITEKEYFDVATYIDSAFSKFWE